MHELPDLSPAELSLVRGHVPAANELPSTGAPTPGLALAAARVPGSPTLPDWDQTQALGLGGMLVNAPRSLPPTSASPGTSGSAGSPFDAPLSFDALPDPSSWHAAPTMSFPLIETAASPPSSASPAPAGLDANVVASQFPILRTRVHGKRLVWLDNAATTQKPQRVIDRLAHFYAHENSNIHRAAHTLAARATDAYEGARETTRQFLGASSKDEIVFVRGATEGINLIAQAWGRANLGPGDEVVVTHLEHHANIVPWQMVCAERGASLRIAPVDDTGQILLDEYAKLLGPKTKLVSVTHVSNALGTVTPVQIMIQMAHGVGAKVVVDGAQAVSHVPVNVTQLDCDFYVFSGHKVFAPTGIGAVYGKRALLDAMPPWQGGGNMISDVTFEKTSYHAAPARFEAGTGNIADAVGLGEALQWLMELGVANVGAYEHALLHYATDALHTVPGLTLIGTAPGKAGVMSFVLEGQNTQAVGGLLDKEGIAVRSGHHCAQPILRRFGVEATVRASLAPYNTYQDIDVLVQALHQIQGRR